jgi:signal transduction histidine kinase
MKVMADTIRVLLIEDNPGDARLIREMLKDAGQDVFCLDTAETLNDGLGFLKSNPTDAVLLDLSLPDSFGVNTLTSVHDHAPDIPIVVLTGYDDKVLGIQAVQAGAQDYLAKGAINSDLLSRAVRYAIERNHIELAEREQRILAESFRDVLQILTSTLNLDEVLEHILSTIERVVPHDSACIMLWDHDRLYLVGFQEVQSNDEDKQIYRSFSPLELPTLYQVIENNQALVIDQLDYQSHPDVMALQRKAKCFAAVPIELHQQMIGLIGVFGFTPDCFSLVTADRLTVFAQQAAIAIQNARLFQTSQQVATLEERQRIARDLHDSISQKLFTANVMAESALKQWENNPPKSRNLLTQVHELTTTVLAEMRVLLLELRPASLAQLGFKQLIDQLVQSMKGRNKQLEFVLEIDDGLPDLSENEKIVLYRIVQESLNNVVKHAAATQVTISAKVHLSTLAVHIRDNGRGFILDKVGTTAMGLSIMRERAETIGAFLQIESKMNEGTGIKVLIPLKQVEDQVLYEHYRKD